MPDRRYQEGILYMLVKLLKPLSFLPAILLMYVIFSFSSQDGTASSEVSYEVSYKIVEAGSIVLNADLEPTQISSLAERIEGFVRKAAHMTEYFALAIAVAFPLYVYGLHGIPLMVVAGFICVAFACSDEYHQSFVDGRSPAVRDVLIDSFGVFWGIVLVRIIGWTGRKTIFRPFSKKKKKRNEEEAAAAYAYSNEYRYAPNTSSVYPPPAQNQAGYGSRASTVNGTPYQNQNPYPYTNTNNGAQYQNYSQTQYPDSSQKSGTSKKRHRSSSSDSLSEDMSLKKLFRSFTNKDKQENE